MWSIWQITGSSGGRGGGRHSFPDATHAEPLSVTHIYKSTHTQSDPIRHTSYLHMSERGDRESESLGEGDFNEISSGERECREYSGVPQELKPAISAVEMYINLKCVVQIHSSPPPSQPLTLSFYLSLYSSLTTHSLCSTIN